MGAERIEAPRVAQRGQILHGQTRERLARGALGALAAEGRRQLRHLGHHLGHVGHRAAPAELLLDAQAEGPVEHMARAQHDQQHQPAAAGLARCRCSTAMASAISGTARGPVDLGRADPDAADVEHAVRPPVHPGRAAGRELDEVTVRPHAGVLREVGAVEAAAPSAPSPEAERARRERERRRRARRSRRASSAAASLGQRAHVEPEAAALALAGMDRQVGVAEDEAADDVGAAGDRLERRRARTRSRRPSGRDARGGSSPVERTARSARERERPVAGRSARRGRAGGRRGWSRDA